MVDKNENKHMQKNRFFIDWIVPIIFAVFIAIFINNFIGFIIKIPTASMVPTLNIGDKVLVSRIYNLEKLSRGDLIVFYYEPKDKLFIKRLIGLPNDKIIINDGVVSINGEPLKENYVENDMTFNGQFEVPSNKYFFLGDNRDNSFDSRFWENPYIDSQDIKGKAFLKIYPFKEIKILP